MRTRRESRLIDGRLVALNAPTAGDAVALARPLALAAEGVDTDHAALILRNVPFMSVGPATGHGFEIDQRTLETYVATLDANRDALKSRVTHPETDFTGQRDGIEVLVGYPLNWRIEGDQVRGDIQFLKAAQDGPMGNLAKYILEIADERPTAIGLSTVTAFEFDRVIDPETREERLLARAIYTKAVDFVDDPAANRTGLLSTLPGQGGQGTNQPPKEGHAMNRLRKYLLSIGKIQKNATDQQVLAALSSLSGNQKRIGETLRKVADDAEPTAEQLQTLRDAEADLEALGFEADDAGDADDDAGEPAGNGGQAAATNLRTGGNASAAPAGGNAAAATQGQGPDVDQRVQAALAAERRRVTSLRQIASRLGLGDAWVQQHEQAGTSIERAQSLAIENFQRDNQPVQGLGGRVAVGGDGRQSMMQGIEDALTLRVGGTIYEEAGPARTDPTQPLRLRRGQDGQPVVRDPHERTHEFEHLSLVEIGRMWLHQLGVAGAWSMDPWAVARYATDRYELAGVLGGVALSHSTSDFPAVFANVLNKTLLPAYEEEPSTWEAWAIEQELRDFREARMVSLGRVGRPPRVAEGAEYEYGTIGEKYETLRVFKYGLLAALTWEAFVNDDLSAFNDQAWGFAQTAKALENDLLYEQVNANPTLNEDGKAVFHSDHNNLNKGGAAAFSADTLKEMRTAMVLQRGIAPGDGQQARRLNLRPNTLLVPWELEVEASQLLESIVDPSKNNATPNLRFLRTLGIVAESRLSDNSATAHYLVAAGNRSAPPAKVGFLRGFRTPTIERMQTGSSVDGVTWKLRHVCGAGLGDYRSWQKNDGSGGE